MGKEKRRENLQREEYDRNVEKKDKLGDKRFPSREQLMQDHSPKNPKTNTGKRIPKSMKKEKMMTEKMILHDMGPRLLWME